MIANTQLRVGGVEANMAVAGALTTLWMRRAAGDLGRRRITDAAIISQRWRGRR
ncbi:hypothetical protein KCP76_15330 [Salmonella enterica subsp. enterica serovar Weltevreden]|nr:hypothetical protein KCP76_15330 [Salmonella enterica subsp. enterica serovar Weltevreden]